MPNSPAPPLADAWAEVRTHDQVMRYHRSGVGPTVIVVGAGQPPLTLWRELSDALATRFRVIVPDLPGADSATAARLSDFLEGLGLTGVGVVAHGASADAVLDLARHDADQVARVVLIPDENGAVGEGDGRALASLPSLPVPLLVLPRDLSAAEAIARTTEFLAGDGATAG